MRSDLSHAMRRPERRAAPGHRQRSVGRNQGPPRQGLPSSSAVALGDAIAPWMTAPRAAALRIWFVPNEGLMLGGCEVWSGFAGESTRELCAFVAIITGTTLLEFEQQLSSLRLEFPASEYGIGAGDWRVAIDGQGLKSYFLGVRKA